MAQARTEQTEAKPARGGLLSPILSKLMKRAG